jgi:transcriptional regulator with XRE-family HTH domain
MLYLLRNKGVRVTYSSLYKWENGLNIPNADILGKISDVFDVSTEFFYTESLTTNSEELISVK